MSANDSPHHHVSYRPDIDGLRAIAVLSVVIYHAFPEWLRGGFIGVDIFFVISGYLISLAIFGSLERGSFSFADFYARRIRRIFPALLLVLLSCFAFGWYWLLSDEFKQLGKHMAAGAGFVSNLVLWSESDYFDSAAETKPLLHLWSLGIEEQFYIIWPLMLWLAWKWKTNLLWLILAVGTASMVLNFSGVGNNSTATFFSPQTRFWELIAGSLLAWLTLHKSAALNSKSWLGQRFGNTADQQADVGLSARQANLLSFFGLALILFGLFYINSTHSFPGGWALLPVMGTMSIMAAGPAAWFNRTVLSHRLAIWFGLISFPLYLWHWPLLSLAKIIAVKEVGAPLLAALMLLAVLLAWLTYVLVEKPLRFKVKSRWNAPVLAGLMLLMGSLGYASYKANGFGDRGTHDGATLAERTNALRPNFGLGRGCVPDKRFDSELCKHGVAPNTYLWGDSYAMHLAEALKSNAEPIEFRQQTLSACQPIIGLASFAPPRYAANWSRNCMAYNQTVLNWLSEHQSFEYVILASTFRLGAKLYSEEGPVPAQKEMYLGALRQTVKALRDLGMKPVFVAPPPAPGYDLGRCWVRMAMTGNTTFCDFEYADAVNQTRETDEMMQEVEQFAPVLFLRDLVCHQGTCSAEMDGAPLYRDIGHFSVPGSAALGAKYGIATELQRKADRYWSDRP